MGFLCFGQSTRWTVVVYPPHVDDPRDHTLTMHAADTRLNFGQVRLKLCLLFARQPEKLKHRITHSYMLLES